MIDSGIRYKEARGVFRPVDVTGMSRGVIAQIRVSAEPPPLRMTLLPI